MASIIRKSLKQKQNDLKKIIIEQLYHFEYELDKSIDFTVLDKSINQDRLMKDYSMIL